MTEHSHRILFLFAIAILLAGCTSKLAYQLHPENPSSPAEGELIFSLRNSSIIVAPPMKGKANDVRLDSQGLWPEQLCRPGDGEVLMRCFDDVTASAVPVREANRIIKGTPSWGTTLTSSAIDNDPPMIKGVTVNYKNPAVGVISSVGAGAATGFAIGGPYGAAAGGLLGGVTSIVTSRPLSEEEQRHWNKFLCESDQRLVRESEAPNTAQNAQLFLPVALDYGPAAAEEGCWHLLPLAKHNANAKKPILSGWVYRLHPISQQEDRRALPPVVSPEWDNAHDDRKLSLPFMRTDDFFKNNEELTTFPVAACRRVELQITWWKHLQDKPAPSINFPIMVNDSAYVQLIRLPKSGVVTILPTCGGYSSSTTSTFPANEVFDSIVKQAQAVKDAQDKHNKK